MRIVNKKRFILCTILFLIICIIGVYAVVRAVNHSQPTNPVVNKTDHEQKSYTAQWNEASAPVEIRNNYMVNMKLDTEEKSYSADITVDVYNDSEDSWPSIYFRDYPSQFRDIENGRISEISSGLNVLTGDTLELSRESDPTVFSFKLDEPLSPGETASISFHYKAFVPVLNARFGYQSVGEGKNDFYLGNCIPVLCPYDDGQFQYYPYFAVGECFYSRMANYKVNLNVPSDYSVIGTGDSIIADDNVVKGLDITANAVRDVIFVIGNDYHVATDVVDGIFVNSYYHSGREDKGQEALNVAMDTLKDCNYRLGKYPYSRFNVVETQMEMLGMEYPQVVLITMADEGVPSSVHEIMHQWFYSLVGSNSYTSAWLDESLATYLANPGLVGYSGYITQPYSAFASDPDYTLAMYFCGASMYNRLEEEYGKSTMTDFMRQILEQYAYKEISTQDLVNLLAKYFGADNEILKEYIEPQYLENVPA
ncbi:M1 family metallopeptidase [Eubacterium sp. 1001713B170207_170306_E7]|uniref:M1 family metallopeptidase n=1 Tax=Eubacterium sp. 1001713B170207_170306_E7 TaxID=2787097 RepID=UPI001897768E|nr:M1 family metallopeptidase [Eubacterium sp. 1001713B170207_170306_E7]